MAIYYQQSSKPLVLRLIILCLPYISTSLPKTKAMLRDLVNQQNRTVFEPKGWKVVFLKDKPAYIEDVVENSYQEWRSYDKTLTRERLRSSYKKDLNDDCTPFLMLVLDSNQKLIGSIGLNTNISLTDLQGPNKTYLGTLYVAPNNRKQGVGSALITLVKKMSKALGYHEIVWYTSNPEAVGWYMKRGAELLGTRTYRDHTITLMRFLLNKDTDPK